MPQTIIASTECMAPITRSHPDAIELTAGDLRAEDWVFDTDGVRRKVFLVIDYGSDRIQFSTYDTRGLHAMRKADPLTFVPAHGWNKDVTQNYRQLSSPDGYPRGEFVETCRCGEVFTSGSDGDKTVAEDKLNQHANEANGREIY